MPGHSVDYPTTGTTYTTSHGATISSASSAVWSDQRAPTDILAYPQTEPPLILCRNHDDTLTDMRNIWQSRLATSMIAGGCFLLTVALMQFAIPYIQQFWLADGSNASIFITEYAVIFFLLAFSFGFLIYGYVIASDIQHLPWLKALSYLVIFASSGLYLSTFLSLLSVTPVVDPIIVDLFNLISAAFMFLYLVGGSLLALAAFPLHHEIGTPAVFVACIGLVWTAYLVYWVFAFPLNMPGAHLIVWFPIFEILLSVSSMFLFYRLTSN
jgi:hypothetical protein